MVNSPNHTEVLIPVGPMGVFMVGTTVDTYLSAAKFVCVDRLCPRTALTVGPSARRPGTWRMQCTPGAVRPRLGYP
jgi:hypothetical protein